MKAKQVLFLAALCVFICTTQSFALQFQNTFDYLGPEMKKFTNSKGQELVYIDEGPREGQPVIFFSGAGTSVQAFHLTEFVRTLRMELGLRFISLGRNGFGHNTFVPGQDYADYVGDLEELLAFLEVDAFTAVAISGGGPYMSAAAEAMSDRVKSLHFAAAYSYASVAPLGSCAALEKNPEKFRKDLASWISNPTVWWDLGPNTSVQKIPGFQDTANNEGAHSFFIRGQMGDSSPAIHEYTNFCKTPAPKAVSRVTAPVFMYYGEADATVTMAHAAFWEAHYANSKQRTLRAYPGEGHDVQYRHWDQVLLDIAGYGDKLLICEKGKAALESPDIANSKVASGTAVFGICAWQ